MACRWLRSGAFRGLVGRPEGKGPHEKLKVGRDKEIRSDYQEIGWEFVNCIIWHRIGVGCCLL